MTTPMIQHAEPAPPTEPPPPELATSAILDTFREYMGACARYRDNERAVTAAVTRGDTDRTVELQARRRTYEDAKDAALSTFIGTVFAVCSTLIAAESYSMPAVKLPDGREVRLV